MVQDLIKTLHPYEIKVLQILNEKDTVTNLANVSGLKDIEVKRAIQWLYNKELVKYSDFAETTLVLGKNGIECVTKGLPEVRFLKSLTTELISLDELQKKSDLSFQEINLALGNLKKKEAIEIEKEKNLKIRITKAGTDLLKKEFPELIFLKKLPINIQEMTEEDKKIHQELKKRKDLVAIKEKKDINVIIKEKGKLVKKELKNYDSSKITDKLTVDMLKSKEWKNKEFRHYDVLVNVPKIHGGRRHPLAAVTELIRNIFVEMGFQEMKGPWVETAFWCMDSMWIPQDHPARDTQDTFYLPLKGNLPNKELVKKVKEAYEDGGDTGSKGYKVSWDPEIAKQLLLRTHTTATTFRMLHEHKIQEKKNAKYFYIGRIFRNEAIDATHLPEFHQVEGFVMDNDLTVKDLMGFIKEFYAKMGIHKIKFKLTYNPYTEPSLEALYYDEKRKSWLELINSGVFRPESLYPYGIKKPIVAWGLGVERLAMVLYELDKLKDLVGSECDLDWLKSYAKQIRKE